MQTGIILTDIAITTWFMIGGNSNSCITISILTEEIMLMGLLFGFYPTSMFFLHLENKMFSPGHLSFLPFGHCTSPYCDLDYFAINSAIFHTVHCLSTLTGVKHFYFSEAGSSSCLPFLANKWQVIFVFVTFNLIKSRKCYILCMISRIWWLTLALDKCMSVWVSLFFFYCSWRISHPN